MSLPQKEKVVFFASEICFLIALIAILLRQGANSYIVWEIFMGLGIFLFFYKKIRLET